MTTQSDVKAPPSRRRLPATRGPLVQFGRWWWALPALALIILARYTSTLIGTFFSLTDWSGVGAWKFVGAENYAKILRDPVQLGAFFNTLFLAFGSVLLSNGLGLAFAIAINRMLKTRYLLRTLLFMPVVLSPLAVAYVWKFIFDFEGPLNAFLGWVGLESWQRVWLADPTWSIWAILVVMVWQTTGLTMVIYLAGLASVPLEIEEAAAIDGAGLFQRFWYVTIPSIRPSIGIASTLGVIQGLAVFDQVKALTNGGPAGATETLATQVYNFAFVQGKFGFGSALAVCLTLIILIFALFQQYITRDNSAQKG